MTGTAIISLDCEGRWGISDHLTPKLAAGLTDDKLRSAYLKVTKLFQEYEVPATFAFVYLYTRSRTKEHIRLVQDLAAEMPYLSAAAEGLAANQDGWVGDWAFEWANSGLHEIAFHGATHVPWDALNSHQARREMELTPPHLRKTMVFPRNRVAHLNVLEAYGCLAYRGRLEFPSRAASLLSEFSLRVRSADICRDSAVSPIELPPGVFINWRSGLRRVVPPLVTRMRARKLLSHAAQFNQVAHFWLHPENIASAPSTFENLEAVVAEIVDFRDRGLIEIRTQLSASADN